MSLRLLRGFTLIINDNINLAIDIEELRLAGLGEKTKTFQPGGGDLEIDITGLGIKALSTPFKVISHTPAVMGMVGGPPGVRHDFSGIKHVVDEDGGAEHEHAVDMKGRLIKMEPENMKSDNAAGYDYTIGSIWNYTEMWDGRVMHRFNFKLGGWQIWNFQQINKGRSRRLFARVGGA
ncbi:hypothetical protein GGD81_001390 [Rhodobium orientis]|uniref:Phage tail protein n=1 Tax=Rhodobium orientis TaxID=34017 RepID=A0A327JM09_9HYPH|nr:phage major tail tube protein [Rhodobium orientis]MBB4302363.1 hypothetical protein [Rhodobium orientis]MBK5949067.1 phage tail protein [Rhodobium orientis]RAI26606.1 phage tail protein [Rhodobium orientis]